MVKEETKEMFNLEHSFVRCWNLDTSESRTEIPGKLWSVVPEKDGEDSLTDTVKIEEVLTNMV
jgi:hypothetical protein